MKMHLSIMFGLSTALLAVATPSLIWNTYQDPQTDFCEHVYATNSETYKEFFKDAEMTIYPLLQSLESVDSIQNVILSKPDLIRCHPQFLHLVFELTEDTPKLRDRLKQIAIQIRKETDKAVSLVLKIKSPNMLFPVWPPNKGIYLLCRDRHTSLLTTEYNQAHTGRITFDDWEIICHLGRRRRVEIKDAWIHQDCTHLSIGSFASKTNLQHFQNELEQRLRKKTHLVLNTN